MKNKNFIIIFLFVLVCSFSQGQQKTIDSLELQIQHPTNGLSKVENLNWLGYYYARTNPDKGLKKLDQSIEIAIKNNDSLQLGKAYEYKGINHKNLGNDSLMFSYFSKAEYIYKNIDSKGALPFLILNRGIFYQQRDHHSHAIKDCQNALEYFTSDKDTLLMGYTLGRIGASNVYLGNYTASLKAFQEGAHLLELISKEESMHYGSIQGEMGLLYQKLSEYDTALKCHNKCLEIFKKHDFQKGISNQYNDIGTIYTKLGQFKKALDIYKSAYEIKKRNQNKADIAGGLSNLGITYSHLKQYDMAIIYLDSAKVMLKELNNKSGIATVYKTLGTIYLDKKLPQKAASYFNASLEYAKKSENKRAIYFAKEGLAEAAFTTANFKKAYKLQKDAITLKENMLSDDNRDELANLKAKYEYEKEKAILEADFEKNKIIDEIKIKQEKKLRNLSIASGGLIILFLFYYLKQRHTKEKLQEVYLTETRISKKVHDELANDVYHVINKIQNKQDALQNDVVNQLENIYQRTRDISYENGHINLDPNYFNAELKEMLGSYQNEQIKISIIGLTEGFWNSTNDLKKITTSRVLKELMTNMKKHSKSSHVVLTFKKDNKTVNISYVDNGIGIKETNHFKNNGLQNAENRIKNINGNFNFDFERDNGLGITMSFPV